MVTWNRSDLRSTFRERPNMGKVVVRRGALSYDVWIRTEPHTHHLSHLLLPPFHHFHDEYDGGTKTHERNQRYSTGSSRRGEGAGTAAVRQLGRSFFHGPVSLALLTQSRSALTLYRERNFRLADLVTISNGICGSYSIFSSARYLVSGDKDYLWLAHAFPLAGLLFDFMDGKVARWRNESSMLGQELDSLADLVSPTPRIISTTPQHPSNTDVVPLASHRYLSEWHPRCSHSASVSGRHWTCSSSPLSYVAA